ncbi:response regulator [Catenovulum sp. SX2]|uniref:response regulator n=1 Tax=Catenovulum sp. SX2 TaxID=3398614 RepID=UPI003F84C01B
MMIKHILLVEDEVELAQMLAAYLQQAGFIVTHLTDGATVMQRFKQNEFDFIVLDLMLPNVDGISLCNQIRQISQVPIIMTTARVDEIDRLLGLEIGADDYICKPYSPREVVARVKTIARRLTTKDTDTTTSTANTSNNPLKLNLDELEAYWQDQALNLTLIEFRLLEVMLQSPKRVFSREQLMDKIYTDERIVSERTIDSHITKLRRKLNAMSGDKELIQSVYGAGYKLQF